MSSVYDAKTPDAQDGGRFAKEISGIVRRVGSRCSFVNIGDRVCATGPDTYGLTFRTKEKLCQRIPDHATFEQAALWPITFATAYHALTGLARLQNGDSVLISAAGHAVSQAAIQIAKNQGACVYVTVRSEDESLVAESYGIPRHHMFEEDNDSLAKTAADAMNGQGFKIVLNTTGNGEALHQLWLCVGPEGKLVDTSCLSLASAPPDMPPCQRGAVFRPVDMGKIACTNLVLTSTILQLLLASLRDTWAQPIRHTKVFRACEVGEAFAHARESPGLGSTVIGFREGDEVAVQCTSTHASKCAQPRRLTTNTLH